jgi:hypothetical protein
MRAHFELLRLNGLELVLTPEDTNERLLVAAFLEYDANVFHVSVERAENGHIQRVRFCTSESA